jgi:hypothetical protein
VRTNGTRRAQWCQLYRRSRRQGDDSFPKKGAFLFQQPVHSGHGIEEPKEGSLKDFEICGVPEKEPPHNGQKAINPFGTVICPK